MSFHFMAAGTVCSDFGAQENRMRHRFTCPLLLRVQKVKCVFRFTAGLRGGNRFPGFPTRSQHPQQVERLLRLVSLPGRLLVTASPRVTLTAVRPQGVVCCCRFSAPRAPCVVPPCSTPTQPRARLASLCLWTSRHKAQLITEQFRK